MALIWVWVSPSALPVATDRWAPDLSAWACADCFLRRLAARATFATAHRAAATVPLFRYDEDATGIGRQDLSTFMGWSSNSTMDNSYPYGEEPGSEGGDPVERSICRGVEDLMPMDRLLSGYLSGGKDRWISGVADLP